MADRLNFRIVEWHHQFIHRRQANSPRHNPRDTIHATQYTGYEARETKLYAPRYPSPFPSQQIFRRAVSSRKRAPGVRWDKMADRLLIDSRQASRRYSRRFLPRFSEVSKSRSGHRSETADRLGFRIVNWDQRSLHCRQANSPRHDPRDTRHDRRGNTDRGTPSCPSKQNSHEQQVPGSGHPR